VASQAETTAPAAAPADLDEEAVAKLGIRRVDGRGGWVGIELTQPLATDGLGRWQVGGWVDGRDVQAREMCQGRKEGSAIGIPGLAEEVEQRGKDGFAFADRDRVEKRRNGFGVGRDGGTARDEERVMRVAICGPQGQSSLA
jgi:hypothetical protein